MASSILGIFMTLISSGIPLATAKLVSKYEAQNELKRRNQVVTSALLLAIILAALSSAMIYGLKSLWGVVLADSRAVEILIITVPSIIFSAVYAVFRGALWGQNDFFNCGLTELIEQLIRFALTFVMLFSITDYFVATKYSAIAFNITCLISAVITIFIYFKRAKLCFKKGEFASVFKSALPITGVRLANSLVQPITTLIIPAMLIVAGYTKSEAVASFGVIMGMTFPMLFVPMSLVGSISMVLIPSITAMMTKNEYDKISNNIKKSIEVSIFVSMLFIPLYLSVGDLIGLVLYKNALSGALLQLSAVCILPITLCNLTGSILNALNLEIKSFFHYMIGSAVLIVCLLVFTPLIGINAVIVAHFLSMSTITLLNIRKIQKSVPNLKINLIKMTIRYSLIATPCSLLGHFTSNLMLKFFTNFFAGLIGGSLSVISTVILCKVFNLFEIDDLIALLKRKKKKEN